MLGNLKAIEIESILKHQVVARLGCHADNVTYVVPLSYAYDGVYLYGRSQEGMKIDLMRKNPRVCIQADIMENMANWQSVVAWGDFEELTDTPLRNDALQKLVNRKLPFMPARLSVFHLNGRFLSEISKV
jgi:nitroimidazol reductase NimA-like FMN-containing flavoprotein (pyridoxamine 5'-phosphate oxidase superfamily)